MKMADVDINPFSDHGKLDTQSNEPLGKTIPLTPGGVIGGESIWDPEHKMSFRGKTQ